MLAMAGPGGGQEATQSALYLAAPILLEAQMRVPAGLEPETPAPLVIGLHGGGSNPTSFLELWADVPNADFIYLALQGPYGVAGTPEPAFDWAMWPKADPDLMRAAADLLPAYVTSAIEAVRAGYSVDAVYLLGFSQGAIYSYLVGTQIPDQLEGLVIFGGPGLESPIHSPFTAEPALPEWIAPSSIADASDLRVFIAHGRSDPAAEFSLAEESRDVLLRNGYDVTFRPFEGGHEIPVQEILAEAADWILSR